MATNPSKPCLACFTLFNARKDSKTCSVRCRKRLQRSRMRLRQNGDLDNLVEHRLDLVINDLWLKRINRARRG